MTATVPEMTAPRKPKAFFAQLDVVFDGLALRDPQDRVFFQYASTGRWIALSDVDMPRLVLRGAFDLAEAQRILDGDKVFHTSKTVLQHHNRGLQAA